MLACLMITGYGLLGWIFSIGSVMKTKPADEEHRDLSRLRHFTVVFFIGFSGSSIYFQVKELQQETVNVADQIQFLRSIPSPATLQK